MEEKNKIEITYDEILYDMPVYMTDETGTVWVRRDDMLELFRKK